MQMHEKFPQQEQQLLNVMAKAEQYLKSIVKNADISFAQKWRTAKHDITTLMTNFDGSKATAHKEKQQLLVNARSTLRQERALKLHYAYTALQKARKLSLSMKRMHSLKQARNLVEKVANATLMLSRTVHNANAKQEHIQKVEKSVQQKQQKQKYEAATLNKAHHAGVLEVKSFSKRIYAMLNSLRNIPSNPFTEITNRLKEITVAAEHAHSHTEISTAVVSAKQTYLDALAWTKSLSSETQVAAA